MDEILDNHDVDLVALGGGSDLASRSSCPSVNTTQRIG
jgi:hypothetical protein